MLAIGLSAAPAGASGAASTLTVTGFGDGSGSCGTVDANGNVSCTTLRAAVGRANLQGNTPTIDLQSGTYQLNNPAGQLDLAASMNIVGMGPGGAGGTSIQQTDGKNRVLQVDGSSRLTGLEITGGQLTPSWSAGTTWAGGGILVEGALVLQNALVTGNQVEAPNGSASGQAGNAAEGGGIAYGSSARAGSLIESSVISGNQAVGGKGATGGPSAGGSAQGGGIAYSASGPLIVRGSTIGQNSAAGGAGGPAAGGGGGGGAGNGGGIFNTSDITLRGDTVAGNTATGGSQGAPASASASGGPGWGGGIFSQEGVDRIVNSTVFGNSAQGGSAASGGSPGNAYGGGVLAEGSAGGAVLQSDTIDANQSSSVAGNLSINVGLTSPHPFTIHDTIVAGGSPTNCGIATPASSESYNLEDDATDSCGFTAASHDLVGATPELQGGPTSNGGPTQTLAPAPGSPALGAGGPCLDPTSSPAGQRLSVDQRNEPRPSLCDIGAFEAQPPQNTFPPEVTGAVARGQTLICTQGAWIGDGAPQYAFSWLRNGVLIPGRSTNTYVVTPIDAGQTLACRVTATYYGAVAATSPFVIVPGYPVITLLKVSISPTTGLVSLGCRGTDGQRCIGAVKLTLVEKLRGREVAGVAVVKRRTVTLARRTYSIPARHTATVRVALYRSAAKLLARFTRLPVTLSVTQTTPIATTTEATRRVNVQRASRSARHRR